MKYFGLFISIGIIIAGLSGKFVLRGTDSSLALVVAGCVFLIIDIVKLTRQDNEDCYELRNEQTQNDDSEAYKYELFVNCLKAAEKNDLDSQISLASMYYDGIGVRQNYEQAAHWYLIAAENESPEAQAALGGMYYDGLGVKQDYLQAFRWFSKAAEQGDANAQYYLGICNEDGTGTTKDIKQAIYWYKKASEQGVLKAKERLEQLQH